jgi:hypothetical protein
MLEVSGGLKPEALTKLNGGAKHHYKLPIDDKHSMYFGVFKAR